MSGFRRASRVLAALSLLSSSTLLAMDVEIVLPPRPPASPKGAEFARSIAAMPLKEREESILAELKSGNMPPFLRKFVPVDVAIGGQRATYFVAPDYLAIGSDDDYFLTPMTPRTAQTIADLLGCTLPTSKMVDDIYVASTIKRTPSPIPPSPAMTTVPAFLRHNETVLAQGRGRPPGPLVAGHKKDVVIARKVLEAPGNVAIYGWHRGIGDPIQPLYSGHRADWVDYSHGIRLVHRQMIVDGRSMPVAGVLADRATAPLISHEGPLPKARYETTGRPADRPDEASEEFRIDRGVRVVINRPRTSAGRPVLLVFYGLPNGNTIEETAGKLIQPGDDWRFDIQQIAAQARFLRGAIEDREVVVAYLENDLKSWPAWRRMHGDRHIPAIVDLVKGRLDRAPDRIALAGHSGGGSFIFGYLNAVEAIPGSVERFAFLDANYGYETGLYREKLVSWLLASDRHFLCVLAYDDARALLDGKPFVSEEGGTWGKSRLMRRDLERSFPIDEVVEADPARASGLGGRVTFLLKQNPERKVLHTLQVEKNGLIEGMLSGTRLGGIGYTYFGERAYTQHLRSN